MPPRQPLSSSTAGIRKKMSLKSPAITFIYLGLNRRWFRGAEYHLGSEYIRAYLASCGITSTRLTSSPHITLDQLARQALDTGAPVIGFTCYDNGYYLNRLMAENIKKIAPDVTILFGGPSATFSDRLILKNCQAIDICVRGEGEVTVKELLCNMADGRDLRETCGISFKDGKRVIRTPERLLSGSGASGHLDLFASPYLTGMVPPQIRPYLGVLSSRGCPYSCSYCNFAAMSGHKIRTHSVERVLDELEAIIEGMENSNRDRIDFIDDTLTFYPERAKEIFRGITMRGLNRARYWCETRADMVDEELIYLMKEAGVFQINFGLESADPVVLNRCRKLRNTDGESDGFAQEKEFLKKIEEVVSTSYKIGLNPTLSIILGLPGETEQSAGDTLRMVRRLGVKTYSHNLLSLHAGTELFLNARRFGMRVRKSPYTLPYYTKLSYDPYNLPLIEDSTTIDHVKVVERERDIHYVQKMTGTQKSDDRLSVLFYHTIEIKPSDLEWIKTFCFLSLELGWIAPAGVTPQDFAHLLVETGLPSLNPHLLVPGPGGKGQYVWADYISQDDYPDFFPVFHFVPISNIEKQEGTEKAVFIYTLTDPDEHSKFIELAQSLEYEGVGALAKPLLEGRFSILDECRWSNTPCPACNLSRLIIHPGGRISPCITGGCVGEVGDDINEIKKRLEQLRYEEEEIRGCATCKVRDTCSRCLFPAPVGRDEFCNLQRNNPGILKATTIISNLRAAYLYQTLPKDIFSTFYSTLPPETLEGIKRLAKALSLRKTLNRKG